MGVRKTANIVRGEDRVLTLAIKQEHDGEPYDLTGWTKITVDFKKQNGQLLQKTSDLVGGQAASAEHEGVTFTADNLGTDGNSISLVFNGTDDINTVVGAWNSANPSNTASHDGAGTDILSSATINLSGGEDQIRYVDIMGNAVLGKMQVILDENDTSSLRLGKAQTIRAKIEKDEDTRYALFRNAINVTSQDTF